MRQNVAFVWLIVTSVLLAVASFAGTFVAAFSVMMFDAPGSENNRAVTSLFATICAFPMVCGATLVASWILYNTKSYRTACTITVLLPVLNLGAIGIAIACLQIFHDGKFAP